MDMASANYSNQNLAGILSEALGLESGLTAGRGHFSSDNRKALGEALDRSPSPGTFAELVSALELTGAAPEIVAAVARVARERPGYALQAYAQDFAEGRLTRHD